MGEKIFTGCKVKIKYGIKHPTFSNMSIANWVGEVLSIYRKNDDYFCKIHLNDETIQNLPKLYVSYCKKHKLNYAQLIIKLNKCDYVK